ncbi:aminotransferase class V-fold PLP-dependent enzyme [Novispirillum itersonii]|uniref:cysteine desulfurase n=1 Tax=Novispirillum itersonii TaxID=189 RepID=A0A7X0DM61_NOVIT|nr:cysteine desulfurase [Novispirillum itersonii]MBB6208847.1 cysteine desulfurase/selenocysteine lyase [Novispirillum itersonii]
MNAPVAAPLLNHRPFDVEAVRRDFPILSRTVHGKPLAYLDSGASAQKPQMVLDAVMRAYSEEYANVHRGAYWLSERATANYESVRGKIRARLNAADEREIVLTHGATEAFNLIAQTYGRTALQPGDEIIISALEHHSNIVPWHMLRDEKGLVLKIAPIHDDGSFDMAGFEALLTDRTRLVSVAHVSNVLGTVLPVAEITAKAHAAGAVVVIDGCQGVVHRPVDVQAIGCDFYVFAPHKLYAPTGIGVLYGRLDMLERMPPWMGGGDMISSVTYEKSEWAAVPAKFEAGTPPIVSAIGLAAALDYLAQFDAGEIHAHEEAMLAYAMERLADIDGLTVHGTAPGKSGIISFSMAYAHPHDIATVLDRQGVCVRAGHHCAQPLMERLGVPATARASFGMYTNTADIDALVKALRSVQTLFG